MFLKFLINLVKNKIQKDGYHHGINKFRQYDGCKIIPERKPAAHKKHNDIDHQVIYDITRADQYQEGILIGYIASIEKNANNLTKSGTITPVVDFQHLREVLVITTLKDTGEKELSSQKASDTQTETQDNTETQKSQE